MKEQITSNALVQLIILYSLENEITEYVLHDQNTTLHIILFYFVDS